MTSDEIKFMAECEHRGACGRLVTMHAISHADPFDWCMCAECPHHEGHPRENARLEFENAKLRKDVDRLIQAVEDLHDVSLEDRLVQMENENVKLRELCSKFAQVVANDDVTFRKLREIAKRELGYDFIGAYDSSLGDMDQLPLFSDHMRELGVEVDHAG